MKENKLTLPICVIVLKTLLTETGFELAKYSNNLSVKYEIYISYFYRKCNIFNIICSWSTISQIPFLARGQPLLYSNFKEIYMDRHHQVPCFILINNLAAWRLTTPCKGTEKNA